MVKIVISRREKEGILMATLEDIARALGVSKSTVSKALSGAHDVSESMRTAALEKAVELGYAPPTRRGTNKRIALFITNMSCETPDDFGYDIMIGFRKMAEPAGYLVDIIQLNTKMQQDNRYDAYMVANRYSGGFFLGLSLLDPWIREFETCKTPTVLYDNHIRGNPNVAQIAADSFEGMHLAIEHLKALGHRKIGYLSSALQAYVYQQRYHAFFRAIDESGLPGSQSLSGCAYHISDCLTHHLPRLLDEGCTAIVCSHDNLAYSVLLHCRELGLRVPEDISIVGFDDMPLCRYARPPLTTIRQDRMDLGKCAFSAMSALMSGIPVSSIFLRAELIQRSSCTAPKTKK